MSSIFRSGDPPRQSTFFSLAKGRDGMANVQRPAITRGQKEIFPRHVPVEQRWPLRWQDILNLEFNKNGSAMQLASCATVSGIRRCAGSEHLAALSSGSGDQLDSLTVDRKPHGFPGAVTVVMGVL